MIDLVNSRLVPVWLDVRREPVPPLPDRAIPPQIQLDGQRRVKAPLQLGFFLRSLVISPDGSRVLNPQPDTPEESKASLRERGYFSYAQVKAADYLPMLLGALAQL